MHIHDFSNNASFNICALLPNYNDLTADNFKLIVTSISATGWRDSGTGYTPTANLNPSVAYDPDTGNITVSGLYANIAEDGKSMKIFVDAALYYLD